MRGVALVLIAASLGGAAWAGVSILTPPDRAQAGSARLIAHSAPLPQDLSEVVAAPETDADRRARLNARLQTMLDEGKGARLTDAPPRPPARAPRPARAIAKAEPSATFAPPAHDAGAARPAVRRAGGYVPPTLDLKTPPRMPQNDLECLTQAVYYEARNESEEGQAAVAEVVINRSRHRAYPKSICEVVYQRNSRTCQFTFTCDGSIGRRPVNAVAWARAERIAREVHEGRSSSQLPKNSVNYHANYVRPSWGARLARVRQIGAHIFYGAPLNGGSTPGADEREAAPARLLFVRNEALDRAYAVLAGQASTGPSETPDTASQ
ncbi:cell wall hydrolase [Brevundimonas guildfordensis]|uniref:Cell wall hydrolase n=1 Tax=Brevundimonas guildfordensis TaxID=2762241 RepID=A0ABR8R1I3_9CAUL|nr:cell wall hydrolase [Brevundimonas guildfordensis]MBD7941332.1 cell wall hydrolase [Brevundimonas guildfordensis]